MKKLIIFTIFIGGLFLAFPSLASATTLYLRDDAVNWTDSASWSTTSATVHTGAATPTAADDCIAELLSGNVTISATSVGKSFSSTAGTGTWAGTMTHNTFSLTISGSVTFNSGMTYTPTAGASLIFGASGTLTTGGKLMSNITNAGSGTLTLGDNLSFMASKLINFVVNTSSAGVSMGGFTISGNSSVNRVLIRTNLMGSTRTLTLTGGTFANADFRDILFNNAGSNLNLSAITGLSGNVNNSNGMSGGGTLTMTASSSQAWNSTGAGNWSDSTKWTSRVPLPQDDCVISQAFAASPTITQDMPRMGNNIDFSGSTNTFTLAANTLNQTVYGSFTLASSMTFTTSASGQFAFESRSASTLTSAGKTFAGTNPTITFAMLGGSMAIQDALLTTGNVNHSNGTITNPNNSSVTFSALGESFTTTRALTMCNGSCTWTATGVGSVWNVNATGFTLTSTGSTISSTDVSGSAKTFAGAGLTYGAVSITSDGTAGTTTFTGANTISSLTTGAGGIKSIVLPGSATTTFSTVSTGLGNGTNVQTFTASAGSSTISSASGNFCWDYVNMNSIIGTGGATFYAGTHSTDSGGNTGWSFTACPAAGANTTNFFWAAPL